MFMRIQFLHLLALQQSNFETNLNISEHLSKKVSPFSNLESYFKSVSFSYATL